MAITLETYIHSNKANELSINNKPDKKTEASCIALIVRLLNPLENLFQPHAINLHSGYRSLALNDVLKSKSTSQHLKGNAADFNVVGISLPVAYRMILESNLIYDQLLLEGKEGSQWIHISFNTSKQDTEQRMQHLELPNA